MSDMIITYADMTNMATKFRQNKESIEQQLSQLGAEVHGLIDSGFVAQAGHTFGATFDDYQAGATKVIDALDGLATYLEKAAQAIQDTDHQLSQAIQGQG
jgi:WXG100 family type VII secretion target